MSTDDEGERLGRGVGGDAPQGRSDPRLEALDRRLHAERRREEARQAPPASSASGWAEGLKLGSEFVAGVVVGAVIGYTIDRLAGIAPWGMIVFLLLGFAAGTLNVLRATGRVAERTRGGDPGPKE